VENNYYYIISTLKHFKFVLGLKTEPVLNTGFMVGVDAEDAL
jgi:hypothetical protein